MTQGTQKACSPINRNRVSSRAYKKLFPIPVPPDGSTALIQSPKPLFQKLLRKKGRMQKTRAVMAVEDTLFSLLDKNRVKKIVASKVRYPIPIISLSLIHIW